MVEDQAKGPDFAGKNPPTEAQGSSWDRKSGSLREMRGWASPCLDTSLMKGFLLKSGPGLGEDIEGRARRWPKGGEWVASGLSLSMVGFLSNGTVFL